MNAYPTTSGPLEDISPRTVELIEAAAELLLLSRRSRPDAGRHEWQSFTATVLPLLFDDEITADDICDAIEIASRQGGQVMSKARDLINAHLYPVLATFAVVYGAIQIAPIAQQARTFNACMADVPHMPVSIAANLCAGGDGYGRD